MEQPSNNPLATESFSHSWLVEKKPHSSHKSHSKVQSFDFDIPLTSSSYLCLADEIFSDGLIMPVYTDRTSLKTPYSVPQSPVFSGQKYASTKKRRLLLGKWRKSSKKILKKWFGLVKPLMGRSSRKSNRVDDLDRKVCEVRSWSNSVEASPPRPSVVDEFLLLARASPRVSPARASNNGWCVDESSIHEAILYCKRSIEK